MAGQQYMSVLGAPSVAPGVINSLNALISEAIAQGIHDVILKVHVQLMI
jgi:hypothetical protein